MRMRTVTQLSALLVLLALSAGRPASAQWVHNDPYAVDWVAIQHGNYVHSAGSNSGYVEALFPSGADTYSEIKVRFQVYWTYGGPPQSTTISYKATSLTGSAGSGSKAYAGVEAGSAAGSVTKDTDNHGNPFNLSNVSCGQDSIFTNNIMAKVYGYARVNKGTGSSGSGTATVQANVP